MENNMHVMFLIVDLEHPFRAFMWIFVHKNPS